MKKFMKIFLIIFMLILGVSTACFNKNIDVTEIKVEQNLAKMAAENGLSIDDLKNLKEMLRLDKLGNRYELIDSNTGQLFYFIV